MNVALKTICLATFSAMTTLSGAACAQASKVAVAPVVQPAPAAIKAPITTVVPGDWILYDDTTYTPVVDDVSRHLYAARLAFYANDHHKAALELGIVADKLKAQSKQAASTDKNSSQTDIRLAQDTAKRLNASALKVSSAAAAVESGKIKTREDLDRAIDSAARADMEHRWLVTDMLVWYPVSDEPQHNFTNAAAAYARKDYKIASADIRKAAGYMRLEAGGATGEAKRELDSSVEQLGVLATSIEKGTAKAEQSMAMEFAKADDALALEHRSKAAESWARKDYGKTGYELKVAAHGLESAASWVSKEAAASASVTVADTRALGDKFASGATWTRDEVVKVLESLSNGIETLGRKIGIS
jgi:hypothetical protein